MMRRRKKEEAGRVDDYKKGYPLTDKGEEKR